MRDLAAGCVDKKFIYWRISCGSMPPRICPRCDSEDVKLIKYMESTCVVCQACGYDERDELDLAPEQKVSQKAKGSYTPYKTGGKNRTKSV